MVSTTVSALSFPRSIRIIAAVLPTALVIEKMRKTVSIVAGCPGLRSPAAPDHTTPAASPTMPTRKGASSLETASLMTLSRSDIDASIKSEAGRNRRHRWRKTLGRSGRHVNRICPRGRATVAGAREGLSAGASRAGDQAGMSGTVAVDLRGGPGRSVQVALEHRPHPVADHVRAP